MPLILVVGLRGTRYDGPLLSLAGVALIALVALFLAGTFAPLGGPAEPTEQSQRMQRLTISFLSTLSEQLRTPLASVRVAASLLEDAEASERPMLAGVVNTSVRQLDRLIDDITDCCRLEAKALTYRYEQQDLGELVMRVCDGFVEQMADRELDFVVEIQEAPMPVCIDQDRIARVISGLLDNAMRFTPRHGTVRLVAADRRGRARVTVSDTGLGLAPAFHEKVFTKFFQVNDHRASGAGAGLGLWIARVLVEDGHQGRIWARSEVGQGSTFTFELPAG